MNSLYICYFGIDQPLVQTQVLPYLRLLASGSGPVSGQPEIKMTLLTFEPIVGAETHDRFMKMREALSAEGITWEYLRYHKTPSVPATVYDILLGALLVRKLIATKSINLIHARVHVPCLMAVIGRALSFKKKPRLLFDIRGFFPEEYVDAGLWKGDGLLFRFAKMVERVLFKESDGFIVLTEKARDILFPESLQDGREKTGRPVEVIPCCVETARFAAVVETREERRRELGISERNVIAYVGSLGGWYMTDEMAEFFSVAKTEDPKNFALILTQSDSERIKKLLIAGGLGERDFLILNVTSTQVPDFLVSADAAISFIKPCYSKLSSSPTKIAEYLASGLPVISSSGIGDVTETLEKSNIGVVIEEFKPAEYRRGLSKIKELHEAEGLKERCRDAAFREFDMESVGGPSYRRIYERMIEVEK
jgi:glycosyltransferase involved in cell wall biosynthesis